MKNKQFFLRIIGCALFGSVFFNFYRLFFLAYFAPVKMVLINVNRVGEAHVEAVFLILALPCVFYVLWKGVEYRDRALESGV